MPCSRTLLFLLMVLSVALVAQTNTSCKEREVLVNVLDEHGTPIKNGTSNDFKVSYWSRPAKVEWSQHKDNPDSRIFVLLDVSGSMKGSTLRDLNKWNIARAAASEFVSLAPSQAWVSLISFASTVQHRFGASGGRRPIQDWLDSARVREGRELRGRTVIYDAILAALKEFSPGKPGDAIYIITDGGENASKEKMSLLERSLQDSGVRLFALLVPGFLSPQEQVGVSDLYELARRSGGFLVSVSPGALGTYEYDARAIDSVRATTRTLQAQIASFYVLSIQLPRVSEKYQNLKVEIVDSKAFPKGRDVSTAYPGKLPGCTAQ